MQFKKLIYNYLFLLIPFLSSVSMSASQVSGIRIEKQAEFVINRLVGSPLKNVSFSVLPSENGKDVYTLEAVNGQLKIGGSSAVALSYAFNVYLRQACYSMITWSGKHLQIPARWPDFSYCKVVSPYELRYYLNVVTFGYTTPYWDWKRWEKEIDWMAFRGINMPLATVASEAIAERVWQKLGLTKKETRDFFTGPAHLPWHRMGNLNGFDGPLTDSWQQGQIRLQHQMIRRMRELGMHPVAPAFAGFVPEAFMEKHPELKVKRLKWGGFPEKNNAFVLAPDSPFFEEIGKLFVQEWEKEFGKNTYYLSDSFNEMELPVNENDKEGKYRLLEGYGESIYKSIMAGNPDAIWVTQGWTFGYQHKFWDKPSLQALLRKVPDDKMIIIDLANDYPKWVWHTDLTWKTHDGFYGKKWIFSYTPNFGGKTPLTGELEMYATYSAQALRSAYRHNLVGFGSAPEGIENNEIIYELLADMGWKSDEMNLDAWKSGYCKARYGAYPPAMKDAFNLLQKSAYSSLYSYPRFVWQTVVPDKRRKSLIDTSDNFMKAVELFASCSSEAGRSELYKNDLVELAAMYLGAKADIHYRKALKADSLQQKDLALVELKSTIDILTKVDRLLQSHPSYGLQNWVNFAQGRATNAREKATYESNAKRLITTWGGFQEDYAARIWNGLILDYYIPRLKIYFSDKRSQLDQWEEKWINTPWKSTTQPYANPVMMAKKLIEEVK